MYYEKHLNPALKPTASDEEALEAIEDKELLLQLAKLEKEVKGNSRDIENIFMVLKELVKKQQRLLPPKNKIGFKNYD